MIELIFVIIIIGILAAVAIPKLSATRDDAKASKAATNLALLITDIGAYYTARGTIDTAQTGVDLAADGCFTAVPSGVEGITVSFNGANAAESFCVLANTLAGPNVGDHKFGGTGVSY